LSRRTDRVSGLLREEISRLMIEQLNDPRLTGLVTIARAEVSADLQHATIAITVIGDEQQREIIKRGDNVLALLDSLRNGTPQSEGVDEDG
jgi:ribosome-binding factor A